MIPAVSEGKAGVEDEGSQLAALTFAKAALKETVSARWLDLCAGPGGKTALIGSIAAQHGITVLANEPYPHRAQLVRSSTKSLPRKTIEEVIELDGREVWKKFPQTFDAVLVDVPCSGLGALRRRPEARWTKTEEDIHELATLQNQLLNSALDAVKPGGVVAYVTCSPVVEETTQVVDSVLAERSDCERLDARSVLREIAPEIPLLSSLPSSNQGEGDIHDARDVQLFEHLHGTDQMFIALIRRLGAVFV
jgi:16S rRNA (cytosine967-C5)-methyltransferase